MGQRHAITFEQGGPPTIPMRDMEIGAIGIVRRSSNHGYSDNWYVVRTYDGFVNLNAPQQTWRTTGTYRGPDWAVEVLPLGAKLTLRVNENS